MKPRHIWVPGWFAVAVVMQLCSVPCPTDLLGFPVNLLSLLLVGALAWHFSGTSFVRYFASISATTVSISSFILSGLIMGLFPQLSASQTGQKTGLIARLGCYDFMHSWIFASVMLFMVMTLIAVTIKVLGRRRKNRLRFALNHIGLLLVIVSTFCARPDTKTMHIRLDKGETVTAGFMEDGSKAMTGHEFELAAFEVSYYPDGTPEHYEADVKVDGCACNVSVNHPVRIGFGTHLYLTGYDAKNGNDSSWCIVQMVSHPWRVLTVVGIMMMFAGAVLMFVQGPFCGGKPL